MAPHCPHQASDRVCPLTTFSTPAPFREKSSNLWWRKWHLPHWISTGQTQSYHLWQTELAEATAVLSMVIPDCEKNVLVWTKSYEQSLAHTQSPPSTCWWSNTTSTRDTVNLVNDTDGALTRSTVNWKTWKKQTCTNLEQLKQFTSPNWTLTLYNLWHECKPGWQQPNEKTSLIGARGLTALLCTYHCSRKHEWNSAFEASFSAPFTQTRSKRPSCNCLKR